MGAILVAAAFAAAPPAQGQSDLPPIAAPTTSISVGTLSVVRSESQQVTDYASGLFEGLLARENIFYGALVLVSHDRVDMAEVFGRVFDENALFALGSLSDIFGVVAAMQLVQEAVLFPAEDIAMALGEPTARGMTLGDLLAHRIEDNESLLPRTIERASGMSYDEYVSARILAPLGMTRSHFESGAGMIVSAGDMSQFMSALLGEGPAAGGQFLFPPTIEVMQRQHFSRHPSLPGWAYGFAEMERNGWRALQRDGASTDAALSESRIVIIPELQTAYFVAVSSDASPEFWRALDDSLFDRIAPRRPVAVDLRTSPAPTPQDAFSVAGQYRADADSGVFLKIDPETFRIEADGANLLVREGRGLVLHPISGGAWRSEDHFVPATVVDGVFWLGSNAYRPINAWQNPIIYSVIAGILALLFLLAFAARVKFGLWMGLGAKRG